MTIFNDILGCGFVYVHVHGFSRGVHFDLSGYPFSYERRLSVASPFLLIRVTNGFATWVLLIRLMDE